MTNNGETADTNTKKSRSAARCAAVLCVAFIALAHIWLGRGFIKSAAPTYDEPVHLASGYSYWTTGQYRINIFDHPPLAELIAALPLLPLKPASYSGHPFFKEFKQYEFADLFLYANSTDAETLLDTARLFCLVLWTAVFLALIVFWTKRAGSGGAACFAAAAFALTPAFISNDALATTDAASAAFYFAGFFALAMFSELAQRRWIILAGICAGLALASKYNMILIPPAALALAVYENYRTKKLPWPEFSACMALYLIAALVTLAAVMKFTQLPFYAKGLLMRFEDMNIPRYSFAFGYRYYGGAWWYFPFVLLVKTPLPLLFLAACGLAFAKNARWKLWLLAPPLIYFLAACASKLNIGYRHLLPVMPFAAVWAGLGAKRWLDEGRKGAAIVAALFAWLSFSVWRAHPDYLAYFNELDGGPANGYRLLTDSNLDWGQGLKELSLELKRIGNPPVYLCYFGTARPGYYGIKHLDLASEGDMKFPDSGGDSALWERKLLAVSATNLQSTYYNFEAFKWLRGKQPFITAGHSLFVYDLTGDAPALENLAGTFELFGNKQEAGKIRSYATGRPPRATP